MGHLCAGNVQAKNTENLVKTPGGGIKVPGATTLPDSEEH